MRMSFPLLRSYPKAEWRRRRRGEERFFVECRKALRNSPGFTDLSRSRRELYQELVVGTVSDPLEEWLGWSRDEIRSQWNWALGLGFLNNSEFSLGTCCPSSAGRSRRVWQTCSIALVAEIVWKKWLGTPSASTSTRFGVTSQSGRSALILNSCLCRGQCWSSVERWETGGVSRDPSCGPNGDLGDAKEGIVWKLFFSWSDSFL